MEEIMHPPYVGAVWQWQYYQFAITSRYIIVSVCLEYFYTRVSIYIHRA
jgi:hypothetical protein